MPKAIHSDNNPNYWTNSIETFCHKYNIKCSKTQDTKFGNNLSESINNHVKKNIVQYLLDTYPNQKEFKEWRKHWPSQFKHLKKNSRPGNKEFRHFLFHNEWFHKFISPEVIKHSIQTYNRNNNSKSLTKFNRQEQATLGQFIQPAQMLLLAKPKYI